MERLLGLLWKLISDYRALCCFDGLILVRGAGLSSGICFERHANAVEVSPKCSDGLLTCREDLSNVCRRLVLIVNQKRNVEKNRPETRGFYGERIHKGAGNQCRNRFCSCARLIAWYDRQRRGAVKVRFFTGNTIVRSLFLCGF